MILILRDLILFGKKRFSNLLESVEGINQKTLSIRLKELENGGIIKKKDLQRESYQGRISYQQKRINVTSNIRTNGSFFFIIL